VHPLEKAVRETERGGDADGKAGNAAKELLRDDKGLNRASPHGETGDGKTSGSNIDEGERNGA
jgi:hypothetical protein